MDIFASESTASSAAKSRSWPYFRAMVILGGLLILCACLFAWLTATLKLHMHIPIGTKNGRIEYFTVLNNQNCVDLFIHAQDHDRAGESDQGTIDFKAGVKSPGFGKLAAKIRAVMIELADCRDAMEPSDYFDELITHSHIGYWTQAQMPLRIYVPDKSHSDGFNDFDSKLVEKCYAEWCSLVPSERLSFKMVDAPEKANIVFSQKGRMGDLSYSKTVLAHTRPLPAGPEKMCVFPNSKATIEPLRNEPEIESADDKRAAQRHVIFLHEIGHSLGIIGHSCNAGDLMYFSGTSQLSERDKATIRRIYAPGSIYERAEKCLRNRAAGNDKYALIQLATQLDQCGTASPQELVEIYKLTKRAADLGVSKAKLMLGWMYHDGNGVKRDLLVAAKNFHQACAAGNPSALLALATIYEKGDGVKQDMQMARKYLEMALRVDLHRAPIAYGNFLSYEFGDQPSQERAAGFYKTGCSNDQIEALLRMALLYEHGDGVDKQAEMAATLRAKAREQVERLQARDAAEYFARGCAWAEITESKKAIDDFSKALQLKPDFRAGYLSRGAAYQAIGDNNSACKDMDSALALDPDCVQAYLGRAYANLGLGRAAFALKDANSVIARSNKPDSDRLYSLMVGSLACRMMHNEEGAKEMLDEAIASSSQNCWPGPIVRFLAHQIKEADFEKEAMGYSRSTEVRFYLAMDQSLKGKVQDAINNLQWVKDNGDRTFYEYPVAIAQLDRLQKFPPARSK